MKKIFLFLLLFFLSFIILSTDVFAGAGSSGVGSVVPFNSGSAVAGTCSGGYCLKATTALKLTLLELEDDNKTVKSYGNGFYIKNDNVWNKFFNGDIYGHYYGNSTYKAEYIKTIPLEDVFTKDQIKDIINPSGGGWLYNASGMKNAAITSDNDLTPEFKVIVYNILKYHRSDLIGEANNYDEIPLDVKSNFSRFRILIEPVSAFCDGKDINQTNSCFYATSKGIAYLIENLANNHKSFSCNTKYCYGVVGSEIHKNLQPENVDYDVFGEINANGKPITSSSVAHNSQLYYLTLMRNADYASGYHLIRLSYDGVGIPKCDLYKDGDNLNLNYSFSPYPLLIGAYNFSAFLDKNKGNCCEYFKTSTYKDELLKNVEYSSIFDTYCNEPKTETKICEYDEYGGTYTYYKKDGNTTSEYSEFLKSCGCENEVVKSLKSNNSNEYRKQCSSEKYTKANGSFKKCVSDSDDNRLGLEDYESFKLDDISCEYKCNEDINFYNLPITTNDTYEAGRYFNLSKYPELTASKTCTVTFNYDKWKEEYNKTLVSLVNNYEQCEKYNHYTKSSSGVYECDCKKDDNGKEKCSETSNNYTYDFSCYKVSDGNNLKIEDANCSGILVEKTCNDSISFNSEKKTACDNFSEDSIKLSNLKSIIQRCDGLVKKFSGNSETYYKPEHELYYYYEQDVYQKNGDSYKYNKLVNSEDDAKMTAITKDSSFSCNGGDGSNGDCVFNDKYEFNNIIKSGVESTKVSIGSSSVSRTSTYKYSFKPSKEKHIDTLNGNVGTSGTLLGDLGNEGRVYSININAKAQNGNKNRFVFTSIGHNSNANNSLQKLIETGKSDALTRECTYNIKNTLYKCDDNGCPINALYRIVDPNNIDPNGRLTDNLDNGFKNWDNKKGEIVKEKLENTDIYNPDNLEYSFTLDSKTIQDIRNYNVDVDYSSTSDLKCNEAGNECTSSFITEALDSHPNLNGNKDTKQFANSAEGRNKWKYFECVNSNCTINEYKQNEAYNSLSAYKSGQSTLLQRLTDIYGADSKNEFINP